MVYNHLVIFGSCRLPVAVFYLPVFGVLFLTNNSASSFPNHQRVKKLEVILGSHVKKNEEIIYDNMQVS